VFNFFNIYTKKIKELMKNFEDFKVNEEWSQQDTENLTLMCRLIQRRVPSFNVNVNGPNGSVSIEGKVVFTTRGSESPLIISTFVNGYLYGLAKR